MIGEAPTFSPSDFVAVFNQTLEFTYPEVIVSGEVSNFRISKNAWVYFDLKDNNASVKFFGSVRNLPSPIEDGMLLEVVGRPRLHPQYNFSINFDYIELSGEGTINKALNLLIKKLKSEGLFDDSRKRALPFAPEKIGLVTSSESAAYGDFMKIIISRWPSMEVEIFDTSVQGRDAPDQVISSIDRANSLVNLEVLVIIRGGGSKDDLAVFNNENVVRAIAKSRVPTVVAIGHERDESVAELVADLRASTPSNAAEIISPDVVNEKKWLELNRQYLGSYLSEYVKQAQNSIASISRELGVVLKSKLEANQQYISSKKAIMLALDPKKPLGLGYALPRSDSGRVLKTSKQAIQEEKFNLEFKDATIKVKKES